MRSSVLELARAWEVWANRRAFTYKDIARWQFVFQELAMLADPKGDLLNKLKKDGII